MGILAHTHFESVLNIEKTMWTVSHPSHWFSGRSEKLWWWVMDNTRNHQRYTGNWEAARKINKMLPPAPHITHQIDVFVFSSFLSAISLFLISRFWWALAFPTSNNWFCLENYITTRLPTLLLAFNHVYQYRCVTQGGGPSSGQLFDLWSVWDGDVLQILNSLRDWMAKVDFQLLGKIIGKKLA